MNIAYILFETRHRMMLDIRGKQFQKYMVYDNVKIYFCIYICVLTFDVWRLVLYAIRRRMLVIFSNLF